MIKGVAFDLEGTVINLEFAHFYSFARAIEDFGALKSLRFSDAESFEKVIPGAIGGGDDFIARNLAKMSCGGISSRAIIDKKRKYFNSIVGDLPHINPRTGFLEVFMEIKSRGLHVSLTSITPPKLASILLKRSNISDLFSKDCILLGDSVKNIKPAPDIYLESAGRMGIMPDAQLVFEDSAPGIKAATEAGSMAIGMPVYYFKTHINKLQAAGAKEIFSSWEEIDIESLL
jgi:beta-phosphoglucomutase-like phosphatase (HAD superfamily)